MNFKKDLPAGEYANAIEANDLSRYKPAKIVRVRPSIN